MIIPTNDNLILFFYLQEILPSVVHHKLVVLHQEVQGRIHQQNCLMAVDLEVEVQIDHIVLAEVAVVDNHHMGVDLVEQVHRIVVDSMVVVENIVVDRNILVEVVVVQNQVGIVTTGGTCGAASP